MANENKSQVVPFIAVTTLFFAWGFITAMVDPLIASLKTVFSLTNAESMLAPFAYFIAYGVVSLPAAALVARAGYGKAIVIALVAMIVGCLVIPITTQHNTKQQKQNTKNNNTSNNTEKQVAAN